MANHEAVFTVHDVRSAFTGAIAPARLSWLYRVGLFIVAVAMVVLPLCYIGVIALAAFFVRWHLVANVWLLSWRGASWLKLLLYVGPAVAGAVIVFFMIKPLFAKPARHQSPTPLDADAEPVLFAFIARISDLVRSPRPSRVVVDCQVNASASFEHGLRGLFQRRLVLTIGLPLVAGLSPRQLAGVLAHELGHFAQGAGMGVTFIIRSVNFWFARVVYERDEWDERLERWSSEADWRLGAVLNLARAGVWLSRKVLYGLMVTGHAVSSFMLRQMEFDADYYEIALAGSASFASTMQRMRELGAAAHASYGDLYRSSRAGRVPENFPAFMVARAAQHPPETPNASDVAEPEPQTGWFDTHPSDAERTRRALGHRQGGVVAIEGSAERLFSDFAAIAQVVTRHHYAADLGLDIEQVAFTETTAVLAEAARAATVERALADFSHGVTVKREALAPRLVPIASMDEAVARLSALREAVRARAAEARDAAERHNEAWNRQVQAQEAFTLLDAHVPIQADAFGLEKATPEHAQAAIDAAASLVANEARTIESFQEQQRERLGLALSLVGLPHPEADGTSVPGDRDDIASLCACSQALARTWPAIVRLRQESIAWMTLAQFRHESPATYTNTKVDATGVRMQEVLGQLAETLRNVAYPFATQPDVSVAAHLATAGWNFDSGESRFATAVAWNNGFLTLYDEVLGRLAETALQVENVVLTATAESV